MQTPTRTQLLSCALVFWTLALGRLGGAPRGDPRSLLPLAQTLDWVGIRSLPPRTTVRIATLGAAGGLARDDLHIGAQARLNGRIVHELAPRPHRDGVLELLLPRDGGGLLEIQVAVMNGAACVTAAASELLWLGDRASLDVLALVVHLTPLYTPLCR